MIACLSIKRALQAFLTASSLGLACLLATGCEQERYPEEMTYPLRTDPLVTESPTDPQAQPVHFDSPGQYPQLLLVDLRNKKAKIAELPKKEVDLQELEKLLNKNFGTPAHPRVGGIDKSRQDSLQLGEDRLAKGSVLYRRHCLHCHGLTGDGRGHTAPWINPHPRDFRRGVFKFTSSSLPYGSLRKARRADLLRTLRQGIEGTAMPTFGLLPDDDLEALISYVIHLSLRGEVERSVMFERDEGSKVETAFADALEAFSGSWKDTQEKIIELAPYHYGKDEVAASITRGHQFFAANCLSCHENYGRKDVYKYDVWGTIVRPANLTAGIYRGGRRPIDLYWRIQAGINGSTMPEAGPALAQQQIEVWDVVNFVQALPYPAMLPDGVRSKIYSPSEGRAALSNPGLKVAEAGNP